VILKRLKSERRPLPFLISRLLWRWRICHLFATERRGYGLRVNPTAMPALPLVDEEFPAADEYFFEALNKPGIVAGSEGMEIDRVRAR